jgi:hypothetical protein
MTIVMHKVYFLIFLIVSIVSCKQSAVSTSRAIKFYDSINHQVNLTRPPQQAFIDKATLDISQVKENKNAIIDTIELPKYLESAKITNINRLKMIENINEVDPEINYKEIMVNHVKLLSRYYNNEFTNCIKVLGSTQQNRFENCSTFMVPALTNLKTDLDEIKKAKIDFKNKYRFTAPSE